MSFNHDRMQIKQDFPCEIQTIEHIWIPLKDGTRLAARIWLPVDAEQSPVPALLEYLPYRKNDWTAWRDAIRHPYLAGHGYASVRIDMRGNGDSDGLMLDEYTAQELSDALEVLSWLEAQPWCTGKVGIFGKSWGGFNGLQIAALKPPQLKAIITIASTDDRYADDVHYMGGCLLASEMLPWASSMLVFNASPPDPRFVGEAWRELWRERLEETPPFVEAWMAHQRRDAYWQHGSICENYADIDCAVYVVGSWADGYTNAVPRLLSGLTCPKKGLIGSWAHNFPENSSPEPAIGFLQESLRWWDYWLKGDETGVMAEPMLRSWIQESYPPSTTRLHSEGRWVVDPDWPSPHIHQSKLALQALQSDGETLSSRTLIGLDSERWLKFGGAADFAPDQQGDNQKSLSYKSAVQEAYEILGLPTARLTLQVDQPQASLAVRLSDIDPNGVATLVTWGLYNLTHRESHLEPTAVPVNQSITVEVPLNICGHRLAEGHHWLVAISPAYWPHLWPAPNDVTLKIEECELLLPTRTPHPGDHKIQPFDGPECAEPLALETVAAGHMQREWIVDPADNSVELIHDEDGGRLRFPDGLEMTETARDIFHLVEGEPLSATVTSTRSRSFARGDWQVNIRTESTMTSDVDHFYLKNWLAAYEGEELFFEQRWEKKIPRDFQ